MKLKEFRSVQKKLNKATGKSLQCGFEKQGCFLRLENFPVPKDESEMNVSNADPRAEDSHCATMDEVNLGVQGRASWAAALFPQTCKKSQQIKEVGSVSGFSKCF